MARTLTETQILKKLNIPDFRHLTKEKVVTMAAMLDRMDPDVAKKALDQFPQFSSTMSQIFAEYRQLIGEGLKSNDDSIRSFYQTCDDIIVACQKMLENEDLSINEKQFILEQMMAVAKMKGAKDSENKNFIFAICGIGLTAAGIFVTALATSLGSNFKIDTDSIKKLMQ